MRQADHEVKGMSLREMNLLSQRSNKEQQSQLKVPNDIKFDFDEYIQMYALQRPG